jgi:hypothetical protein
MNAGKIKKIVIILVLINIDEKFADVRKNTVLSREKTG